MKKVFFISVVMLLFFGGRGQINYNQLTSKFTLSTTSGNHPLLQRPIGSNPTPGGHVQSSAFVFEYGDGYFTSDHSISTHYYAAKQKYPTVLTLSALYDTIKPPQVARANIVFTLNPSTPAPQQLLNPGEMFRITPIASNLTIKDEMLFLITYIVPEDAFDARVYFFYNQPSYHVLEPATETSTISQPYASEDGILRLRTYFGETWDASANFTNTHIPGIQNNSFDNLLAWQANGGVRNKERNLFITLRTKDNFPDKHAVVLFQGALTYKQESDSSTIIYNVDTRQRDASADPHDPNYIISIPHCVEKTSRTMPVTYHVHFQNEGGGDAHPLHIDLFMDEKLTDSMKKLNKNSFKITVGEKVVPQLDNVVSIKNNKISFNIDLSALGMSTDLSLRSNKVENWFSNPLTMGDIYFDLNIPKNEEADIISYASIVFHNRQRHAMPAVNTRPDTLFVREHCSGNLLPRIKPLPPKPQPCKTCCTTILSICWWWWIIIILTLLGIIVIWLLVRRKKDDDKSRMVRK